jgi:hypothetical protein
MRSAWWGFTPPEHPSGYHGHYDKECKPLIDREELEKLATNENLPIFDKYFQVCEHFFSDLKHLRQPKSWNKL